MSPLCHLCPGSVVVRFTSPLKPGYRERRHHISATIYVRMRLALLFHSRYFCACLFGPLETEYISSLLDFFFAEREYTGNWRGLSNEIVFTLNKYHNIIIASQRYLSEMRNCVCHCLSCNTTTPFNKTLNTNVT